MNRFILLCASIFSFALQLPLQAEQVPSSDSLQKSQSGGCSIVKIAVCKSVEKREPVGVSKEFVGETQLYCWVRISCPSSPVILKHKWYKFGNLEREIPLSMNVSEGRIWSMKNVTPGNWKVEVTDAAGSIIASESFTVK